MQSDKDLKCTARMWSHTDLKCTARVRSHTDLRARVHTHKNTKAVTSALFFAQHFEQLFMHARKHTCTRAHTYIHKPCHQLSSVCQNLEWLTGILTHRWRTGRKRDCAVAFLKIRDSAHARRHAHAHTHSRTHARALTGGVISSLQCIRIRKVWSQTPSRDSPAWAPRHWQDIAGYACCKVCRPCLRPMYAFTSCTRPCEWE